MSDRWTLPAALGIAGAELVAFVGGGGKTSLMFALAAALPGRVVITTTTRIFAAQMRQAAAVVYAADLSPLGRLLEEHGRVLVVGHVAGDKAHGVAPDLPGRLLARPDLVLKRDGHPALVLDTKYKVYGQQPNAGDINQMVTYCHTLGVQRGVLIYPGEGQPADRYKLLAGVALEIRGLSLSGRLDGFRQRCDAFAHALAAAANRLA